MDLSELELRPIEHGEDERYQQLLERHHYLGAIPKIGQTLRYVAQHGDTWVALLIPMSVQDETNNGMLRIVVDDWSERWRDLDG